MNMLDHFEKIVELINENGLCETFFKSAEEHLNAAAGILHTSPVQTVIFALFLDHFGEYSVSLEEISGTLKCGKIQLIRYMDDLEELQLKKLIRQTTVIKNFSNDNSIEYTVPLDVIKAVREGIEYKRKDINNLHPIDFFDYVEDLLAATRDDDIDRNTLLNELKYLYENNGDFCFVKKLQEYDFEESSLLVFLDLCCSLVSKDEETIDIDNLTDLLGRQELRNFQRSIKANENELYAKGLIEFVHERGLADTNRCRLSRKAKDEFLTNIELKQSSKRRNKYIIPVENIQVKRLFYSEKVNARIKELTELLQKDNFSNIQKRLSENGMRTGFACIFSGSPGTGKTETAYQIARETGRDIMLVDISETKSMWFGESEKLIKAVFEQYRALVKDNDLAPILLFNEADAVLGKRRELSNTGSGPDQTENAIQNIILQEMEDLNGILIATTNMTVNLDKAFERRFLYKIEFEKPDAESKRLIWQSLIPGLSDDNAIQLSRQFDFSGGQIENIARKRLITLILRGFIPELSDLEASCREELMERQSAKIGFQVS